MHGATGVLRCSRAQSKGDALMVMVIQATTSGSSCHVMMPYGRLRYCATCSAIALVQQG
jgi:hypothetical protein